MPRVWVREQDGVRQVLGQPVGVAHRNHLVMEALHHQRGMTNALQVSEALAREPLPLAKRGQLCAGNIRPGGWFAVFLPQHQSRDERLAGGLARRRRREEDLSQDRVAAILWILDVLREAWLLEMHDVLTAARSGAD